MRLPNPNSNKPYERTLDDGQGNPVWGIRNEGTPDEEIVHIPTGRSNQAYYQPEKVLDPSGCAHQFVITDMGKREVECRKCHWATTFIMGVNLVEEGEKAFIVLKGQKYLLDKENPA